MLLLRRNIVTTLGAAVGYLSGQGRGLITTGGSGGQ